MLAFKSFWADKLLPPNLPTAQPIAVLAIFEQSGFLLTSPFQNLNSKIRG